MSYWKSLSPELRGVVVGFLLLTSGSAVGVTAFGLPPALKSAPGGTLAELSDFRLSEIETIEVRAIVHDPDRKLTKAQHGEVTEIVINVTTPQFQALAHQIEAVLAAVIKAREASP